MVEIAKNKKKLSNLFFDPFEMLTIEKSLYFGTGIILLPGIINSISNTYFDGILDIHTGKTAIQKALKSFCCLLPELSFQKLFPNFYFYCCMI